MDEIEFFWQYFWGWPALHFTVLHVIQFNGIHRKVCRGERRVGSRWTACLLPPRKRWCEFYFVKLHILWDNIICHVPCWHKRATFFYQILRCGHLPGDGGGVGLVPAISQVCQTFSAMFPKIFSLTLCQQYRRFLKLVSIFCHDSKNIFIRLKNETCQFRKHFGDRPWSGDGQSGEALVRETNGQFSCNKFNFSRNKFNFSRHTWSCTAKTSKSLVKPNIGQFNHTLWPSFAQQNIFDRLIRYLRYHQIKVPKQSPNNIFQIYLTKTYLIFVTGPRVIPVEKKSVMWRNFKHVEKAKISPQVD